MSRLPAFLHFVTLASLVAPLTLACGQPGPPAPQGPAATQSPAAKPAEAPAAASPVGKPAAQASPSPAAAAAKPAAGQAGGTFVVASLGPLPNTLHPYPDSAAYTNAWTDVAILIWDAGLLDLDANTLEYAPYMASEWNVSADGKTFTFKLRDGLKWSDGQPITVDDFVLAWQNASKEENDFVGLDDLKRIDSFTAPDPKTIVVTLNETLARDIAIGVANSIGPVPKHIWQGKPWNDPAANPEILKPSVVSGPYLLKDWNAAEGATFVRNPNWFRGQANFDQVVLKPGQQPTVAYELLKSGQAHWAPNIPPSQYAEAKQNPNLNLLEWTAANGQYRVLEFNLQREFLKDKRAREALSRAINRQDVIQVAENNLGQPQYTFLNPANTKWYNPNVEKYDFDLDRARQLLQEAGYRSEGGRLIGSDGQQVRLQVLFPVSSNPRAKIATYLQQQYKQLGIEVEVKGLDFNAYTEEVKKKNYDLSLGSYGGGSIDPDLGARSQLLSDGQQNITGFDNPTVDDLFKKGAVEQDEGKRKAIYDQVQQVVNQELPSYYMYSLTSFSPISKQVVGVQPNKLDRLDYNDALTRWSLAQ
jgi:peptide/nickel transport system substrate-binding protein